MEPLSVSQVKQIAGRAGRFGMQSSDETPGGFATCRHDHDMAYLSECLATPFTPLDFARMRLDTDSFTKVSQALPSAATTATVVQAHHYVSALPPKMRYHDGELSNLPVYDFIDEFGWQLSAAEKVMHFVAPVSWRDPALVEALKKFMKDSWTRSYVDINACLQTTAFYDSLVTVERAMEAGHRLRNAGALLKNMESLHKAVVLYIWMSFRMPVLYSQYDVAAELKIRLERALQWSLEQMSEGAKDQHTWNGDAGADVRRGERHPYTKNRKGNPELGRADRGSRPHIPATTKLAFKLDMLALKSKAQS